MSKHTLQFLIKENYLSNKIWQEKYSQNESYINWLDRITNSDSILKEVIDNKYFLFGGRILANRNINNKKTTYSNCYVIAPPKDNLKSILNTGYYLAKTFSYGGGCGVDCSNLAPKGSKINNASKTSPGATCFMDLYNAITKSISQNGRRGALMLSLDCTHPDLIDFINLKSDLNKCTSANLSIRITDKFMKSLKENKPWQLTFTRSETGETITKSYPAREIFTLIAKRNYEMGEPGILFWDRIQQNHIVLNKNFSFTGINPCGELPLPDFGSCLLGSINLSEFVLNPFTSNANIDYLKLHQITSLAVKHLNLILLENIDKQPLIEQKESIINWRPIGLGTMGLADALIKLNCTYGDAKSLVYIQEIYKTIATSSILTSLELAKQYGCYKQCLLNDLEYLKNNQFLKNLDLPVNIIEDIQKYGLYNSQLLTCAPTGSIATMLNISTGIEPIYALKYNRKTENLNVNNNNFEIIPEIVKDYLTNHSTLSNHFVTALDIPYQHRIEVQAMAQKYIDSSISSTINIPSKSTIKDITDIYLYAWEKGLKGCTIYRDKCARGSILTTDTNIIEPIKKRPKKIPAHFYTVNINKNKYYVIVGILENKPYEIFAVPGINNQTYSDHTGEIIKYAKMHYGYSSEQVKIDDITLSEEFIQERMTTLYISMLLRHNVDIYQIIKTARKINNVITSFTSAICRILSRYISTQQTSEKCPECGEPLIYSNGCSLCNNCGYSKCN